MTPFCLYSLSTGEIFSVGAVTDAETAFAQPSDGEGVLLKNADADLQYVDVKNKKIKDRAFIDTSVEVDKLTVKITNLPPKTEVSIKSFSTSSEQAVEVNDSILTASFQKPGVKHFTLSNNPFYVRHTFKVRIK